METIIQKTAHQIIDEIVAKYTLGTRSTKILPVFNWDNKEEGKTLQCAYVGEEGRTCAFGYMCIDPSKLIEGKRASANLEKLGEEILKPEYRGQMPEFYNDLQRLHDYESNWTENGLSSIGAEKVKELKDFYKNK